MNASLLSKLRPNELIAFAIFAVCPLLFFTDLTRNPYQVQITLLNLSLLAWAALRWGRCLTTGGRSSLGFYPSDSAFLAFAGWAAATWLLSARRLSGFRTAALNEGAKSCIFLLVNGWLAFRMGRAMASESSEPAKERSPWTLILLALAWGALWMPFHHLKNGDHPVWDPYGTLVWALLYFVFLGRFRTRRFGDAISIMFFVSLVAGGYAAFQYFGRDVIWGGLLNPYNGRPVSSFGNPNFLSSYLVMILPLALCLSASAPTGRAAAGYALLSLLLVGSLLCTLTRTSWVGAAVAISFLGIAGAKKLDPLRRRAAAGLLAGALLLAALWPSTPTSPLGWSPLSRAFEFVDAMSQGQTYQAYHQRLLIWRGAWEMVRSHPIAGIGWGCFELLYPFYQGPLVLLPRFHNLRTHANNAHNFIPEMWSQTGLIGLGLFLWLILFLYRTVLRNRRPGTPETSWLCMGLLAGAAGMLADNMLGNVSMFFAVPAFLFWWVLGAATGLADPERERPLPGRPWARRVGAGLLLLSLAAAGFVLLVRFAAERAYFLGFKLSKEGKPTQSIPYLERSARLYPFDVNNSYELGNAYAREAKLLSSAGEEELASAKRHRAIDAYRLATRANPGYDEVHYNLATMLTLENRAAEAFDHLEISAWIHPGSIEVCRGAASIAVNLPDLRPRATRILERAVLLHPGEFDLHNNLGYLRAAAGDFSGAVESFRSALRCDPASQAARVNLDNAMKRLATRSNP